MASSTRPTRRDEETFRFLELPADVRLMVYDCWFNGIQFYALDHGSPAHPQHRVGPPEQTMFRQYKSTSLPLTENYNTILRLNRMIRREAIPFLYRHLLLVLPVKRAWKMGRLIANRALHANAAFSLTRFLGNIRVLELTMNDRFHYVPFNILHRLLPRLKTLILDLSYTRQLNWVLPELSLHPYGYAGGLTPQGMYLDAFDEVMQKDYVKLIRRLRKRKTKLSYSILCFFEPKSTQGKTTYFDIINRSEVNLVLEAA